VVVEPLLELPEPRTWLSTTPNTVATAATPPTTNRIRQSICLLGEARTMIFSMLATKASLTSLGIMNTTAV
jgi:hypothetical protein